MEDLARRCTVVHPDGSRERIDCPPHASPWLDVGEVLSLLVGAVVVVVGVVVLVRSGGLRRPDPELPGRALPDSLRPVLGTSLVVVALGGVAYLLQRGGALGLGTAAHSGVFFALHSALACGVLVRTLLRRLGVARLAGAAGLCAGVAVLGSLAWTLHLW
ncbi:hypothetical protein [Saccharopolyspora sp. CA-218241]|uniref:hypothetical protein n=1 Tax=Saccharopolyspora sp. CA-218241 TaxID=3240027 RepID=UPI003D960DEE